MKSRILLVLVILAGVLLAAAVLLFKGNHDGSGVSFFSPKPRGLTEIATRVPANTGVLVALDARDKINLKAEIAALREKLKGSDAALKGWDEAEKNLGVTADEVSQWMLPAGFVAVLPAKGQTNLWSAPGKESVAADNGAGALTACKSNLKNTATALEMYSTDNAGRYAPNLALLTPNYLKVMPQCPAAKQDTYSSAYAFATVPDAYTLICKGNNHPLEGASDYPQYTSFAGSTAKLQLSHITTRRLRPNPMWFSALP